MMKAIFYKEWIKTRWFILLSFIASTLFVGYGMVRMTRVIELKGAAHIWEVMITRDALFFDFITYIPLLIGLTMGVVQFVPEMYHKSLKLTLHLPLSTQRLALQMVGFGFAALVLCFAYNYLAINTFLGVILPYELRSHVANSTITWFLAGLAGYLLSAWVTLEPTWRRRVVNIIISIFVLRIYFLSSVGEAYNSFLPLLAIYTIALGLLSLLSVKRFKDGKQ